MTQLIFLLQIRVTRCDSTHTGYDAAGRTTTMTALGGTVQYAFAADPSLGITHYTYYTYDADGELTRTNYPNGGDRNPRIRHERAANTQNSQRPVGYLD